MHAFRQLPSSGQELLTRQLQDFPSLLKKESDFRLLLIQNFAIVTLYNITTSTHVFYAAVAHFHIILIEEASVLVMRWEMLLNKTHEPFTNICLHISTKWRFEP